MKDLLVFTMAGDYKKTEKIFYIMTAVSEVLSVSNEPQQLLDMVLDTLLEVLKIDCCWVQLVSLESRKLWLAAHRSFTPDMKQEMDSMELGRSLGNQVAGLGHKIVIADISRDREYGLSSFSKAGLRSLVAVPLRTHHTQGVMGIASRTGMRFGTEVTELLTVIASLVGMALDKARLYQKALVREKTRKEAEKESARIIAETKQKLVQLAEEIKEEAKREAEPIVEEVAQKVKEEAGEESTMTMGKAEKAAQQIAEQTAPSQVDSFKLQSHRRRVPGKAQATDKIKVFVIDDDFFFRQGIRLLFSQTDDIELIGESGFLEDTLSNIEELAPDLVLIDINLPSLTGLDLAQRVSQHPPRTSVIMLTSCEDDNQIFEALRAGVAGYLTKDIAPEGLASAIRRVFKGEHIIDELLIMPRVAQRVVKELQGNEREGLTEPLSPQDTEMLGYFVSGYSCKQVAHAMGVSEQEITNRMASIVSKLVANGRT